MGQRRYIKERDFESPYGKESLFHNVYLDLENTTYPNDETDDEDKYTYKIIPCDSGVDVFTKYKSEEYQPTSRHLFIFVEKEDSSKSNFFGTACRVKMGTEWKVLAQKLTHGNKNVSVDDSINLARNLTELAEDISYFNRGKDTQIDKKVLLNAFRLELSNVISDDNLFQEIFSLNNKLAKWIYSGSEVVEKWKFTDVNYEFKRKNYNREIEEYRPIIPIPFDVVNNNYSNKESKVAQNKGFDNILNFVNNFDSILFNAQTLTAVLTPTNPIDDLFVLALRAYYQEKLPDGIKRLFDKIKSVVTQIKDFINEVAKEKINENVALLNAFLCGLINGLISLLQMVFVLLGFVVDNIPFLEVEKATSREAIDKRDQQFEFIEDLIDTVTENVSSLFNGLLKTFINLPTDFVKLVSNLAIKFKTKSEYFWAFIIGAIGFELILDAIVAFFTGGTSLAVSFANKISRVSTKAVQAGLKSFKQVGKKILTSVDEVYKFLKKEIEELVQAINSGKFIDYLREKLLQFFEDTKEVYDNLISAIGKTERIQKSKSGIEILCFVKKRARVPVDKILKYCRGKVRDVEKYAEIKQEFEKLKKIRNRTPEENILYNKLKSDEHRISRSLTQKKILDSYNVPDNLEWNKKILDEISKAANQKFTSKYGGIGNKEVVEIFFDTPKGKIIFETKWEKIDYAKFWMNTIIIKTTK